MRTIRKTFAKFRSRQDGSATIEFVILFPGIMTLFLAGFEAGYYMVRNVALERAVDIAVRDVRLGNSSQFGAVPDHAALKLRICQEAGIIPDCMRSLKVEVMPVNKAPGGVAAALGNQVRCIDKAAPPGSQTPDTYGTGAQNDLMLIHVCSTTQPLFPSTGFGVGMKIDANGNYAIIAATAFVNEPGARALMNANANGGGNGGSGGSGGGSVGSGGSGGSSN